MVEQLSEDGRDNPMVADLPEEGQLLETSRPVDGYSCYSLEVLRLLED